ncbi:MAG: hypothetical protein CVU54_12190 [Deltaproteobacteria bacterium HGW-Deltaproteobacteria-12]|jgi:predicted KAP-like P-loop ATPase|nr:MAG: hypothetical protein CVU54_12190 [Deltaproteobacteria bacterium HGW-Deltaproteobacteria-12]
MEIKNYINLFGKLEEQRKDIFKSMNRAFETMKKRIEESFDSTSLVGNIEKLNNAIRFQFLDFMIYIELEICTFKNAGLIKWYLYQEVDFEPPQKIFIIQDLFNERSDIKKSLDSDFKYNSNDTQLYFIHTLMEFCEKRDEFVFNQKIINQG